jgi:RecB family exonuclease
MAVCPRSAALYMRHEGGVGSHEMHRGSAFHKFAERVVLELIDRGENQMPWEVAKDLMAEVVADHPEWVIPPREMDHLRLMAFHFADTFVVDPGRVVAVEKPFEAEVGGFRVRGKVDLAVRLDDGGVALKDWKTSPALATQEDIEGSFQLPLYALLVGEGYPVREEPCPDHPSERLDEPAGCLVCGGTGRVETPEPRIGERFTWFDLSEVYPRLEPWDEQGGKVLAHRDRRMSRHELVDHRLYIEGLVAKLRHGLDTGLWPAVPDPDGHCNTCAAPQECPIPAAVRGSGSPIESLGQAEDVGVQVAFEEKALRARKAELREYAKANDVEIPCGPNEVWGFETVESEEWVTGKKIGRPTTADAREQFQAALARAIEQGEEFRYEEYRKPRQSTNFKRRKVTADESLIERLEQSIQGSFRSGAGSGSGRNPFTGNGPSRGDVERERDEGFGADAPW